ncbi:DUF3426 domain-containing protein [Thioalkalivibrio sp. ALJT]|uniref:DUF3426 domain-containing protein n=1 Tax=Thioalkalivibrio sp. ALJT TaxID=1158146 RepID=UPI00037F6066|nr:DUF3426 domain-containing protein [Thioalkalivibrio sp. ALJT]
MLARCPACQVTHAVTHGDTLRLLRVRCHNCGAEFDLLPSLEFGGAGALGRGFTPVLRTVTIRVDTPRNATVKLNIEPDAGTHTTPTASRRWPAVLLASVLFGLLSLQWLLVPPVAPGQYEILDQTRDALCTQVPCPAWHPLRAPEQVRISTPDLSAATDGGLQLQFSLESPVQQAWPVLDIHLSDRLGTALGYLRLAPNDYAAPDTLMTANHATAVRVVLADPPGPSAGITILAR